MLVSVVFAFEAKALLSALAIWVCAEVFLLLPVSSILGGLVLWSIGGGNVKLVERMFLVWL